MKMKDNLVYSTQEPWYSSLLPNSANTKESLAVTGSEIRCPRLLQNHLFKSINQAPS